MKREELTKRLDLRMQADARRFERSRLARRAVQFGLTVPALKQIFDLSDTDINRFREGR